MKLAQLLKAFNLDAIYCVDFETYYDSDYTLKKLSTTEYIIDDRFELQLASVRKLGTATTKTMSGPEFMRWARMVDWSRTGMLAHHAHFDGFIMTYRCKCKPAAFFDTLSMARPIMPITVGGSLDALSRALGGTGKQFSEALFNVMGVRVKDMSPQQFAHLKRYGGKDVDLTVEAFDKLLPHTPLDELRLIDMTIKLYAWPRLLLDGPALQEVARKTIARKDELMKRLGMDKATLMSNDKLAEAMVALGVDPPMKTSPATGKLTYAFAKTDLEFKALLEHDDPLVAALVEARLGVKSTITETRAARLAARARIGPQPIYLKYWGAKCVPAGTEVLTENGWEPIEQWNGGRIAQYTSNGELVFADAKRFVGPVERDWVRVDAPYTKCDFTFGHTVPYIAHGSDALRSMKAADMLQRESTRIPTSAVMQGGSAQLDEHKMRVLVMVQADGSYETDTLVGRRLKIAVKKPRKIARARQLLAAAGVRFTEHVYPSQPDYVTFVVRYADYPAWLSPERKTFGSWILTETSAASRKAALEELVHWDGYNNNGTIEYVSTEYTNASWVQTLAHVCGSSAAVLERTARPPRKTCWRVHIRQNATTTYVNRKHVSIVTEPRVTYCAETVHGMWLARANGHVFVTGNTGRWSGGDAANWQNMGRDGELRSSIKAPPGHDLIIADLAQIEARLNAWFNGQQNIVDAFANGDDVYAIAASGIYGRTIDKETHPNERFVGKVCVAEGTPVLCERGWVPIESVRPDDRVWDGEEWVCQLGSVHNGFKSVLNACGVWMTPDHLVWSGTDWVQAKLLQADSHTRSRALATAAENLPSQGMSKPREVGSKLSSCVATVGALNTPSRATTSSASALRDALYARATKAAKHVKRIGASLTRFLTTRIDAAYLTVLQQLLGAAQIRRIGVGSTTAGAAYVYTQRGSPTNGSFSRTCKRLADGMTHRLTWTASTQTDTTNPVTSGSYHAATTPETNGESPTSNAKTNVYDLLCSGPRNRFVVLGDDGPLIVHNCVLALGYQAGAARFANMLRIGQFGPPIDIEDAKAADIVRAWRSANPYIVAGWKRSQNNMRSAFVGRQTIVDGVISYQGQKDVGLIVLPNNTYLRYDKVAVSDDGDVSYATSHRVTKKGVSEKRTKLYGGIIVENVIQALARAVMAEHMLRVTDAVPHGQIVMSTHDELVLVVPTRHAAKALTAVTREMRTPPLWAKGLPLNVDAHRASIYDK